jgi:nucleotide-binding universal stress UspA family protein
MSMKILVPVDGSDFTKRMLAYIAAHDEMLGPRHTYTLFTAVAPVPSRAAHYIDGETLKAYYAEQAEQLLATTEAFARQQGWKVETAHAADHAVDAIVKVAEQGRYDLIVMGTHGHSALGSVILGSVTTGVLARTKVPVLLVR